MTTYKKCPSCDRYTLDVELSRCTNPHCSDWTPQADGPSSGAAGTSAPSSPTAPEATAPAAPVPVSATARIAPGRLQGARFADEYRVEDHIEEFERAFAAEGSYGGSFPRLGCKDYLLLRDRRQQRRYVVIHAWSSAKAFSRAQERGAQESYSFQQMSRGWRFFPRPLGDEDVAATVSAIDDQYDVLSDFSVAREPRSAPAQPWEVKARADTPGRVSIRVDGKTFEMDYFDPSERSILIPSGGLLGLPMQQAETGGWFFAVVRDDCLTEVKANREAVAREVAIRCTQTGAVPFDESRVEYLNDASDIVVSTDPSWQRPAYLVRLRFGLPKEATSPKGCAVLLAAVLGAGALCAAIVLCRPSAIERAEASPTGSPVLERTGGPAADPGPHDRAPDDYR